MEIGTRMKFADGEYTTVLIAPQCSYAPLSDGGAVTGSVMSVGTDGVKAVMGFRATVGHSRNGTSNKISVRWTPSSEWESKGLQDSPTEMESGGDNTVNSVILTVSYMLGRKDPRVGHISMDDRTYTWEDGADLLFIAIDSIETEEMTDTRRYRGCMREHNNAALRGIMDVMDRSAEYNDTPLAPDIDHMELIGITGHIPHDDDWIVHASEFAADIRTTGDGTVECTARSYDDTMRYDEVKFKLRKDFTAFDLIRGIMDAAGYEYNLSYGSIDSIRRGYMKMKSNTD